MAILVKGADQANQKKVAKQATERHNAKKKVEPKVEVEEDISVSDIVEAISHSKDESSSE